MKYFSCIYQAFVFLLLRSVCSDHLSFFKLNCFNTIKRLLRKKSIPLTIIINKMKYLGISLIMEAKELYNENCKILMNEIAKACR
jgi:hypothetical protein